MDDPIDWDKIIGPGSKFIEKAPICPSGGTYTFVKNHPEIGVLACTCSKAETEEHEPADLTAW
ncbi:MAG: hypothetical protein WCS43_12915 [Verrucomicrobiota bacterium]